jgi:hypothetical protein
MPGRIKAEHMDVSRNFIIGERSHLATSATRKMSSEQGRERVGLSVSRVLFSGAALGFELRSS